MAKIGERKIRMTSTREGSSVFGTAKLPLENYKEVNGTKSFDVMETF